MVAPEEGEIHPKEDRAEGTRLLKSLGRFLIAAGVVLGALALVFGWPLDRTGNGFQLLGILIASLGVPVVPPVLARGEVVLRQTRQASGRWIARRREQLRRWWDRVRRRTHLVSASGTAHASGTMTATVTVSRGSVNRETIGEREWLAFLHDEVDSVWLRLRDMEESRADDRAAVDRRLADLRDELQEHTSAVTREGWRYIVGGLVCSGFGTLLSLMA